NAYNLVLSRQSDDGLAALADFLTESRISFPGVLGPDDVPEQFVTAWSARTGDTASLRQRQRIHECRQVAELTPASGCCRAPLEAEVATLAGWRDDFHVAVNAAAVGDDHAAAVRRLMSGNQLVVWEEGGEIVSCAA